MFVPLLIGLLVAAALALVLVGVMQRVPPVPIEARLAQFAERPRTLEELELERPFVERVLRPALRSLARIMGRYTPQGGIERLRVKLTLAGNPNQMQPLDFIGLRGLAGLVLGAATLALLLVAHGSAMQVVLFTAVMSLLGYFFPVLWLRQKITTRQRAILRALPDSIDLLTISVEAGLGFDAALARVAEKWDTALCREFRRVIAEIRVGKPRREALKEMIERTAVPELATFVSSIIQADQLGVSIAKILRIQADQMRIKRRQLAEEQAHKAPIKMLFPMIFLIFPSIYIVILGPSIPGIAEQFFGK